MRALGIDPGLANFGISVVDWDITISEARPIARSARVFTTAKDHDAQRVSDDDLSRITALVQRVDESIKLVKPDCIAAETYTVFTTKMAKHGWKVAIVYGAIMASAVLHGIPFYPVMPNEVKRKVALYSGASKEGVMRAAIAQIDDLGSLLAQVKVSLRDHAADAAAIALIGLRSHAAREKGQSG